MLMTTSPLAHNSSPEPQTIDVHRLKVTEAVRLTEVEIRNALVRGDTQLRVITGQGRHSDGKIPVLKLAILQKMSECVLDRSIFLAFKY
jgi:DNA-nicking Smr family endonuclease